VTAAALLLPLCLLAPAQEAAPAAAAPAAAPAPAPVLRGRPFGLAGPTKLKFRVQTSLGPVEGTIGVVELEARGLEGWGGFEIRMALDPRSVRTGDELRDRLIAKSLLRADRGRLVVTSRVRLAAEPVSAEEGAESLYGATMTLDRTRRNRSFDLRYRFEGDETGGTLRLAKTLTLEALGLPGSPHPFVQVTGPVAMELAAPMVRRR
jgi:hypothetical protein